MERTYGHFCGLARSLDHVGDRWTLLIIRELLVAPARYRDLQDGLPGVATNLLAQRLRQLEADGIVRRRLGDESATTVFYELTPFGADLEGAVMELVRWGKAWMEPGRGDDHFRPRWLVIALRAVLPRTYLSPSARLTITCREQQVNVTRDDNGLLVSLGPAIDPHAMLTAEPDAILALATRTSTVDRLKHNGALRIEGSTAAVRGALFATPGRGRRAGL